MNRFVFVVFTFPMLPLPFPPLRDLSQSPPPPHIHAEPLWGHTFPWAAAVETNVSPVISWKLPPALSSTTFPLQQQGFFVLSWVPSSLDSVRSDKKVSLLLVSPVWLPTHIPTIASSPRLFGDTHVHREEGIPSFPGKAREVV